MLPPGRGKPRHTDRAAHRRRSTSTASDSTARALALFRRWALAASGRWQRTRSAPQLAARNSSDTQESRKTRTPAQRRAGGGYFASRDGGSDSIERLRWGSELNPLTGVRTDEGEHDPD